MRSYRSIADPGSAQSRKHRERSPDQVGVDPFDDKDQPRPAIGVGPATEMCWRMHKMLHAVDSDRSLLALQRQNSLDPQDTRTVTVEQHGQPDPEGAPVKRLLDHHGEGARLRMRSHP